MSTVTMQAFMKHKVFGDHSRGLRPLQYRQADWKEMTRGKERATRLIAKSLLGVPSAHHGDQDHPMWCFAFEDGSLLTVFIHRGNNQVHLSARGEATSAALREAVDFLMAEFSARLRQL